MHKPSNLMSGTWLRTQAFALAGVWALLSAPAAEAGVTLSGNIYSFTGQNYVFAFDGGNVGGAYTTSQALSWTMTLTAPLGFNAAYADMSPTAWSFDDGNPAGNGTFDSSQGFAYFAAGTNGSGEIVDWLAAFVGPRLGGNSPSDDTGLGLSCGGLGCAALGVPPGFPQFGAALLWSAKAVSQIEQLLPNGGPGSWDSVFAAVDGQPVLAEFVLTAAEAGPSISVFAGGLSSDDVDAAYCSGVRGEPYCGVVPEPVSLSLVGLGLAAVGLTRRARRRA